MTSVLAQKGEDMTATSRSHGSAELDEVARSIVARLQLHIPLVPRPFLALADELGLSEARVIRETQALIESRLVRQVGAIFDGRALGYDSSLVAARCAPDTLERAAAIISSHPGVSHNYQRDHSFNLWYTLAVPPGRSLADEASVLHRLSGAESTRLLPAIRMFKLGVNLDMDQSPGDTRTPEEARLNGGPESRDANSPLTPAGIRAVQAFQEPFSVIARPFDNAASLHGFPSAEALLEEGERLRLRAALRRFSAVLRHREAGFKANGMVVWKASPAECLGAGPLMATFAKVSHCYQRPAFDDWPYSLFTMIHGRTPEEVQECIAALQDATGLPEYRVLYSSVEYKKARVRYFTDEWDTWRRTAEHSPGALWEAH